MFAIRVNCDQIGTGVWAMSFLQYHARHHPKMLIENLPSPNSMPYLERLRALPPEHVEHRRQASSSSMELGLPDFKSLLDDLSAGSGEW